MLKTELNADMYSIPQKRFLKTILYHNRGNVGDDASSGRLNMPISDEILEKNEDILLKNRELTIDWLKVNP